MAKIILNPKKEDILKIQEEGMKVLGEPINKFMTASSKYSTIILIISFLFIITIASSMIIKNYSESNDYLYLIIVIGFVIFFGFEIISSYFRNKKFMELMAKNNYKKEDLTESQKEAAKLLEGPMNIFTGIYTRYTKMLLAIFIFGIVITLLFAIDQFSNYDLTWLIVLICILFFLGLLIISVYFFIKKIYGILKGLKDFATKVKNT
jgi:hypothetical protein